MAKRKRVSQCCRHARRVRTCCPGRVSEIVSPPPGRTDEVPSLRWWMCGHVVTDRILRRSGGSDRPGRGRIPFWPRRCPACTAQGHQSRVAHYLMFWAGTVRHSVIRRSHRSGPDGCSPQTTWKPGGPVRGEQAVPSVANRWSVGGEQVVPYLSQISTRLRVWEPTAPPTLNTTDERLREEQTNTDERLREEQTNTDERLREEQKAPMSRAHPRPPAVELSAHLGVSEVGMNDRQPTLRVGVGPLRPLERMAHGRHGRKGDTMAGKNGQRTHEWQTGSGSR
jgi:hypothetical protein